MPVSPYPDISILISMLVDDLFPDPATFRSINFVVVLILKSLFQILFQSLGLLPVELFFLCHEFQLFLLFIILLFSSDIVSVFLLELKVLSHHLEHVLIVNVDVNYLLAFLQCVVLFVKVELLVELLFQSFPVFFFITLGPERKVQRCRMRLIICRIILVIMRIHIERSQIRPVHNSTDGLLCIRSPIRQRSRLLVKLLKL